MHVLHCQNEFQILDRKKEIACWEEATNIQYLIGYIMIISVKLIPNSNMLLLKSSSVLCLIISHFLLCTGPKLPLRMCDERTETYTLPFVLSRSK